MSCSHHWSGRRIYCGVCPVTSPALYLLLYREVLVPRRSAESVSIISSLLKWPAERKMPHVFTPFTCWNLGRQGSCGMGSGENTESSPDDEAEQEESGRLGEYCSRGALSSRYSCGENRERKLLEQLT